LNEFESTLDDEVEADEDEEAVESNAESELLLIVIDDL
jgi:hypothetical protein